MDLQTIGIIGAALLLVIIGTVIYILRAGGKPIQSAAVLYNNWTEKLSLEPLDPNPKAAEANTKILQKNLKLLWDKKVLEEIELKSEIPELTQEDALGFTVEANELFLAKSDLSFAYDIRDARDGSIRLYSLPKESTDYKKFVFGQAVIKLLRSSGPLAQFPDIEFPEGAAERGLGNLSSFVIAQAEISIEPEELYKITALLSEKFGDEWDVTLLAEDVLKFAKAEPEKEATVVAEEHSPFAHQLQAKQKAEEEAAAEKERIEIDRRLRWEKAEALKQAQELKLRDEAIASGSVSALVAKPLVLLAQIIEIAADEANLLELDDEAEINKADRIGNPLLFTIYSGSLIDTTSESYKTFVDSIISSLIKNFGGSWTPEPDSEPASSISFAKSVI